MHAELAAEIHNLNFVLDHWNLLLRPVEKSSVEIGSRTNTTVGEELWRIGCMKRLILAEHTHHHGVCIASQVEIYALGL